MIHRRGEQGSAMIIALVIVIIAVGIGGAFLADTVFRSKMASASVESDEAQMVCDAALEKVRRALWVYKTDNTYPWDNILQDHAAMSISPEVHWNDYVARQDDSDFVTYKSSYYATGINTANDAPLPSDAEFFMGGTNMPFGEGGFMAICRDNDDGDGDPLVDSDLQLLVYITASLPDGTQRQIEALVRWEDPTFTPDNAILVDGSILFNGTPDVLGLKGSAHANGDVTLTGNPVFSVSVSATGTIDEGTAPVPPDGFQEGVPPIPLPDVNPLTYKSLANYIMQSNGQIYDVGTATTITPPGSGWNGWKYSAANNEWSFSGNDVPPVGTYYIEGNAKLSGAGGSPPRTMSIIAEKSISTTGNIKLTNVLPGTLLIAGGDIQLGGTAGAVYTGLVAANEQIKTLGTFDHVGVLLAKNAADNFSLVTAGSAIDPDSQFGGTMTVTYDGGLETILENPSAAVSVRNVRKLK
jgi:hypothetical protein